MKKIGETYAAWSQKGQFKGERTFEDVEGGRTTEHYKLVCPACKAEGEQLEHRNWFSSKEYGLPLFVVCKCCGHSVDTDNPLFEEWKVKEAIE